VKRGVPCHALWLAAFSTLLFLPAINLMGWRLVT
jgi:hypothetical protein